MAGRPTAHRCSGRAPVPRVPRGGCRILRAGCEDRALYRRLCDMAGPKPKRRRYPRPQGCGPRAESVAAQPARVAAAVEALVMRDDDVGLAPKPRDSRKNRLAELRMFLDHDPLVGVERARLAQD